MGGFVGIAKTGLRAVLMTGLFLGSISAAAAEINCYSSRSAGVYPSGSGQWRVKAEVSSDFTLKNVALTNSRKKEIGSTTKRIVYDRKVSDARLFLLDQDPFCKYELITPRDLYTGGARFKAELIMTCDDMYDATATLSCSRK